MSLLSSFLLLGIAAAAPAASNAPKITDWSQITPSPDINWQPCFDSFQCLRLQVPLDYEDESAGTAAIAFMKYPAEQETAETRSILFNPGGPGASGIDLIAGEALLYRDVFGPDYNLISFDPRGVRFSEPSLDCFQGNKEARRNFYYSFESILPSESETALNSVLELLRGYGEFCGGRLNDSARYVTTPAVARDMIQFTEKEAVKNGKSDAEAKQAKLNYYGISYGTVLGQTLASLYPDRIERIVIDSVEPADDYYTGIWQASLYDSDKTWRTFYQFCFEAGPERCAFYEPSVEDIEARFLRLLQRISEHPIPIYDPKLVNAPYLLNYGLFKKVFFGTAIYGPAANYPSIAKVFAEFERGNGSAIPLTPIIASPCYGCDAQKTPWSAVQVLSQIGISCVDADGRTNISTTEAFKEHLSNVTALSFYGGDYWASTAAFCNAWKFKPVENQKFDPANIGARLSTPPLILGNIYDPVTPIRNPHKISPLFPGSVVLQQNTAGHGVISVSVSPSTNCTHRYVRDYFDYGTLPPVNTTCEVDAQPFFVTPEQLMAGPSPSMPGW